MKSVLIALADSNLDTFVSPKALERVHAVQGHRVLSADLRISSDDFCETLSEC